MPKAVTPQQYDLLRHFVERQVPPRDVARVAKPTILAVIHAEIRDIQGSIQQHLPASRWGSLGRGQAAKVFLRQLPCPRAQRLQRVPWFQIVEDLRQRRLSRRESPERSPAAPAPNSQQAASESD